MHWNNFIGKIRWNVGWVSEAKKNLKTIWKDDNCKIFYTLTVQYTYPKMLLFFIFFHLSARYLATFDVRIWMTHTSKKYCWDKWRNTNESTRIYSELIQLWFIGVAVERSSFFGISLRIQLGYCWLSMNCQIMPIISFPQ